LEVFVNRLHAFREDLHKYGFYPTRSDQSEHFSSVEHPDGRNKPGLEVLGGNAVIDQISVS